MDRLHSRHSQTHICSLIRFFAAAALGITAFNAAAQNAAGIEFIPAQPTSADTVYAKLPRTCGGSNYFPSVYSTFLENGRIKVWVQTLSSSRACTDRNAPAAPLMVELGKFPAGTYPIDFFDAVVVSTELSLQPIATNLQLVVTDHRPTKPAPAVFIDYSDHWWDSTDPGVGLFIWQNRSDQVLGAWFTYAATGEAIWYTIQAGSWVSATRYEGKLVKSSKLPHTPFPPPPNLISAEAVGTAVLDFTGDDSAMSGRFIVKFNSAATEVTRNIRRFGK